LLTHNAFLLQYIGAGLPIFHSSVDFLNSLSLFSLSPPLFIYPTISISLRFAGNENNSKRGSATNSSLHFAYLYSPCSICFSWWKQRYFKIKDTRTSIPTSEASTVSSVCQLSYPSWFSLHTTFIFDFWFFHESVSPKPLSIPLAI